MNRKIFFSLALLLTIAAAPVFAATATYQVDAAHTNIGFKVKHLFSWLNGSFKQFEGSFVYDTEDLSTFSLEGTIQAASIDTAHGDRDKHLKAPDFFDVEKFPTITFKSTGVSDINGNKAKLKGMLTIHGVEKEVVLDLEALGAGKDPWGNTLAGISATGVVNRKDFSLTWNQAIETGGVLVGEEVTIVLDLEGTLQK